MTRTKTILRALLGIGAAGAIAAFGTFSAFSSTTDNPGNQLTTGSVQLTDNDLGTAAYSGSGLKALDQRKSCIKVQYTGLDADVKLYIADAVGPLAQYVDLTITPGTGNSTNCSDFTADGAAIYTGTLQNFRTTHNAWTNGLSDYPASTTKWATGNAVTYEIKAVVQDNNSAQGKDTLAHQIVWEARNQ
jgi:hypothetical protein